MAIPESIAGPRRVVRRDDAVDHLARHEAVGARRGVDGRQRAAAVIWSGRPTATVRRSSGHARVTSPETAARGLPGSATRERRRRAPELHRVSRSDGDAVDDPSPTERR